MNKLFGLMAVLCAQLATAQSRPVLQLRQAGTKQPVPAATVFFQNPTAASTFFQHQTLIAGETGLITLPVLMPGRYPLRITAAGFSTYIDTLTVPGPDTVVIDMNAEEEELEEVVVQSTRTGRSIANTPTRIEVIDGEELDEKNNMRPANVSMLLHESTGLQVQQTSAVTGNASIRVQGLDGRYTQLLKDGYPNFGNFANGLSILEIPPLDLKQVEVIKGPASTLYGGGAIAGAINFISKTPGREMDGQVMLNQSNIGQSNAAVYLSRRNERFGFALLGAYNFGQVYDVDKDGFSELPRSNNYTIHPRLFWYPGNRTTVMLGHSSSSTLSTGGDVDVIKGQSDANNVFFERNETSRQTTTFELGHRFNESNHLLLKQSVSWFNRNIGLPGYDFRGRNVNAFTDLSFTRRLDKQVIIAGLNVLHDDFRQPALSSAEKLDTRSTTAGIYGQHTWDVIEKLKLETGLRVDATRNRSIRYERNQAFVLPRLSVLYRWNNEWTSRIGAGLGYKLPTLFTEQTEAMQYQALSPLVNVEAERSTGFTADVNYRKKLGDFSLSINQLFFYTNIRRPLILTPNVSGGYTFSNADRPVLSRGFETNLKLVFREDLKLFAGYTFTRAEGRYKSGIQELVLLPRHKVNLTLMYEKEDNFKLGLEGYFTDRQWLSNGTRTPRFWEFGFMAQKTFGRFTPFVNFENFTDQRQSRYKRVVNGPDNNPGFDEIWNHTEGRSINGGVKIKI